MQQTGRITPYLRQGLLGMIRGLRTGDFITNPTPRIVITDHASLQYTEHPRNCDPAVMAPIETSE